MKQIWKVLPTQLNVVKFVQDFNESCGLSIYEGNGFGLRRDEFWASCTAIYVRSAAISPAAVRTGRIIQLLQFVIILCMANLLETEYICETASVVI